MAYLIVVDKLPHMVKFVRVSMLTRIAYIVAFLLVGFCAKAQAPSAEAYKPNPVKEKMFYPYLAVRHGGPIPTEAWKKTHTVQYYQELWYYCESFYVVRDYYSEGVTLNEEIIDISRFESQRQATVPTYIHLPGFKDALVLLPTNQLLYKP